MSTDEDVEHFDEYEFRYDILENKVTNDCTINPRDIDKTTAPWLYARNNKYGCTPEDAINYKLVGKWMLFIDPNQINEIWDKIKQSITEGKLWNSKVSTVDSSKPDETHAIMIYTKDYRNITDIISTLDYLESSGLKSEGTVIKYKTDNQTRAGIYRGGKQKPWIYTSNTIRKLLSRVPDDKNYVSRDFIFYFDIWKNKIVNDCTINPTDIDQITNDWLRAGNNKYCQTLEDAMSLDADKFGKWLFYVRPIEVNEIWNKIKEAIMEGDLWRAEVSTRDPLNSNDNYAILIYTKNFQDIPDVISILDYLESHELKRSKNIIRYTTNNPIHQGTGRGGSEKEWMYSSNSIRKLSSKDKYFFNYDFFNNKILEDCTVNPTDISKSSTEWLLATNNKYDQIEKDEIDWDKVGKWILHAHSTEVNEIWNKIKEAIMKGYLWRVKVSTKDTPDSNSFHALLIYTINFEDISDVISTLDYLESSKLKPSNTTLRYKTNNASHAGTHRDGTQKKWLYSSDTIRDSIRNAKRYTISSHRPSRSDNPNWRLR